MVTVAVCILPAIGSTVLLSRPTMQSFLENIKKCYNSFFFLHRSQDWTSEYLCIFQACSLSFIFVFLCVRGSQYTVIVVYVLDRRHPLCVIGQNISFWQHLYFLRTVIKPESEQGLCCWNYCHCFSITALPNAHSSGLQSLWSLLELVPAERTDWWVGGGVCACLSVYTHACTSAKQRFRLCCMFLNYLRNL